MSASADDAKLLLSQSKRRSEMGNSSKRLRESLPPIQISAAIRSDILVFLWFRHAVETAHLSLNTNRPVFCAAILLGRQFCSFWLMRERHGSPSHQEPAHLASRTYAE